MFINMWQLQDFHWINSPQNVTWRMHEGELTLPEEGAHARRSNHALIHLRLLKRLQPVRHACSQHLHCA